MVATVVVGTSEHDCPISNSWIWHHMLHAVKPSVRLIKGQELYGTVEDSVTGLAFPSVTVLPLESVT